MFEKLMGKKKKEIDFFRIPEKRYTTESRIISKMSTKALQQLIADEEKYISVLIDKLEHGKTQYEKATDKIEELQEKNQVVNAQVSRMNNQHQELTIKFDNLQVSLQMLSNQSDQFYRKELQYLTENQVACDKVRSLSAVLNIYRQKLQLCKKIQMQNKNLKTKYTELEQNFQEMKAKIEELEKQKQQSDIVPSLTQEIKQLKEKLTQFELKDETTRENNIRLEENLTQKIKIEMETASTLRSDEEDHDQRNKMTQLQLDRINQELSIIKEQLSQSILQKQQALSSLAKNNERLIETERQLLQANTKIGNLQVNLESAATQVDGLEKEIFKQVARCKELQNIAGQINNLRDQHTNLIAKYDLLNQSVVSKQEQSNECKGQLQLLRQILTQKQEQLGRERQNKLALENIMADKSSSEIDHLMKIKGKLQQDLQDIKKTLDISKKTVNEQQSKIKQLSDERESLATIKGTLEEDLQDVKKTLDSSKKTVNEQQSKIKQLSDEVDNLIKIKGPLQEDLQDVKKSLDSSKKTVAEQQSKIKQLSDEIDSFKTANKNLVEQKMFIQQNASNCLKISQQQTQKYKSEAQQHKKQVDDLKKQIEAAINKIKMLQEQVKNYGKETELLNRIIQTKEGELKKSYSAIQEAEKAKAGLEEKIGEMQEENKIRMRKYESELNQQRIKMQSVNRKLASFQSKAEQNKTSMDNMYEQLLAKQKKNMHMQTKLKEYKYMIQLLRKEKNDLEKTYENKINDMRIGDISIEDIKKDSLPVVEEEQDTGEKDKLTNQLLSTKEQNLVLLAENKELRKTIEELKDEIKEKERNMKLLQEKRDQMMKEIEKIGRKSGSTPDLSGFLSPTSHKEEINRQNRQKKIATKARKGFQILMKLQHQLYKAFVSVFTKQLEREDVKKIECEINTLIKRSSDMCDIFEDYL